MGQKKLNSLLREFYRRKTAHGYTLAELMVAVLLLATLVVSLYAGISTGFAYTAMVREELRAT
ncbi:MAG: prepilin-type N-terminal cleavage/methylation domain-containing protein [Verrucomicrobiota bacterium]|nr:prepilin-type N-terminal cleavage/methylation domain-containing protein [Limisphaera sp.]MDW8381732.1 prepilin-type N-terminal cleavage/methylation domain-containing protein [Verrucomicrobiota bacterium]